MTPTRNPARTPARTPTGSLNLALALALALALGGCSPDDQVASPGPTRFGVVTGHVFGLARDKVSVHLESVSRDGSGFEAGDIYLRTVTDHLGMYRLEPPAGDYRLSISVDGTDVYHAGDGVSFDRDDADTLRVTAGLFPRVADFSMGALRIILDVPPELDADGVRVDLIGDRGSPLRRRAFSDTLTWPMLPAGEYVVAFDMDTRGGYSSSSAPLWLGWTLDEDQARRLVVTGQRETTWSGDFPRPAVVEGSVTGAWQADPSGNPEVDVYDPARSWLGSTGVADDGTFSLDCYLADEAVLRFRFASGTRRWYGGDDESTAARLRLTPGQVTGGIDLVVGAVRVTLQPGVTGVVPLVLETADGRPAAATTIEDGGTIAWLHGLAAGTYYLRVDSLWNASALPRWYPGVERREEAAPIVVEESGSPVDVEMPIVEGGSIAGAVVFDDSGAGAWSEAFVSLTSGLSRQRCLRQVWVPIWSPEFSFVGLQDGEYRIGVYPYGWSVGACPPESTAWWPDQGAWEDAGILTIADHGKIEGLEVHLPGRP